MQSLRVGFIGLGIMGRSMVRNIHRAGFPVTVWNRTERKMAEAREWGAETADSPRAVAEVSDVVITCVGDTPDVREVAEGPEGLLNGAREGLIWVDMSTIAPEATRELAARAAEQGVRMLDAPVSGGDIGAREGTLSIMVGGDAEVLETVRPVLEAMGKNIVHCGPHGAGQTVKACNQILCGLNLLAVVEALAFAKKAGVDLEKMIEVTTQGAGGSWALANLAPRIVKGDLDPGFSVRFQQKDLRIVLQEAEQMNLPLVGTAVVQQLLRSVQAYGGDDDGTHALIRVMERLAGLDFSR
ncbi:NAD(P)-dependent oxidoreductase [Polycladomyces subterraneus]|uniref:NAD(P)-dependent oxidoreductase n=1 Tax=Polycladomyces subterraneus TaxID=1016997 RepID=A0ABT8IP96_9BACL|nr:NAD(P)-dependent oxidoreductase [Polycladomyces subterraneus]MDN4594589.1 NAD(P)-dependent oxidoreductase [Polycladomyces subterraneus]